LPIFAASLILGGVAFYRHSLPSRSTRVITAPSIFVSVSSMREIPVLGAKPQ
jgi:hypothetical protein